MSVDAADCVDQFKQEGEDLRSEIERLKQEGEQVGSQVERLKQEGEDLKSEVERLKQRLTKVVTPRSSFLTTSNRTMPGWGNSAYTRCQLSFSWTELNKGYKEREIAFRTGGLGRHMQEDVYETWVCMDHFCGDPVFCWVYHEIEKIFTPWGTNSELLLITGL
jgi:FtsZ-binding cell division protein ZapB